MKGKVLNILLILIFVAGLSLLLYPTVSDAYNAHLQSQLIVEYAQQVDEMEEAANRQLLEEAQRYNADLLDRTHPFSLEAQLEERYWASLQTADSAVMAYVEIPSIEVTLPIAHGTEANTLAKYVGHMEWSSLPVGGESTHCVISGHRGLPSSELFTNIDHLQLGDYFYIHVLGQSLLYQVDNIAVVDPYDYSLLGITPGKDYTTLVTCTPYGINSHRLLVRGVRILTSGADSQPHLQLKNEVTQIDPMVIVPVTLAVLSVGAFLILMVGRNKRKSAKKEGDHDEKA
ncbi:MAG: class C sortase [Oscillospiraceae bacterium]|nr:class C sortase [Oscillospiraceae bacterium]